jgi:hypothetical protein
VVVERMEAERRRTRGYEAAEMEEREFRVEELGVEGLIREGILRGRGGEDDRLRDRVSVWARARVVRE